MECTQDLYHQQQLEQQEQEQPTMKDLDRVAYQCVGVAQAMRDIRSAGGTMQLLTMEARLIELANEFENLKGRM
jgi:hypothetical protein